MHTDVAIIAIGRNEGERLRACLAAATRDAATIVYVDSGSTDGSVALAKELGCRVVELDLSKPFTAARARNEGAAAAGDVEFYQFVDGDCELVEGWVGRAVQEMRDKPRAAGVCGRRRERFPEATKYNKLCDMEWDTPIGEALACGGDALIRRTAFDEVGGYNPAVIAGEEPEMCVRLRDKGWQIWRIDAEMTLHDAAMTSWRQWWKRNVRAGHAYAEGLDHHPPFRRKEVRSNYAYGLIVPAVILVTLVLLLLTFVSALFLRLPIQGWQAIAVTAVASLGVLTLLGYGSLIYKVKKHRLQRGDDQASAGSYASAVALSKVPQAIGQLKYHLNKRRGKQATIIEYKGATA
jgi:GT2 family glycosyltransferase